MPKRKAFSVPVTLHRELEHAAESKGQTLKEYLDDLLVALVCGVVAE